MEQMTLFDWMPELLPHATYPDINDISEAEAVRIVGDALGLTFTYNNQFDEWQAKKGKCKLSLEYDHFNLQDNHDLFLGTSWECGSSGGAAPCGGIEQAIDWFNRRMNE